MLGVGIGFVAMVVLVGVGVLQILTAAPWLHHLLRAACLAYILWMAWKIARAGSPGAAGRANRPMTFLQAAAFQWVNPKAWAMALTAVTAYAPSHSVMSVVLVAVIFGLVNLPSVSLWAAAGQKVRALLTNPVRLRAFNVVMAVLLIASTLPML
jgi:threonine/homoserine/homoserine lactone efflux protein